MSTPKEQHRFDPQEVEQLRQDYLNSSNVIVAGGRDFDDYDLMRDTLDELFWDSDAFEGKVIKIVSGMARGADTLAIDYADENGLTKILFPVNWKFHKNLAGLFRNEDMLSVGTHLVAFWDGDSHGTKKMIDLAREKGIPVWVINY